MEKVTMRLSPEEEGILRGEAGPVMEKILRSVVLYGEAFGADRLVPIAPLSHSAMSFGASIITPYYRILDEIIESGLKTKGPFTTNPRTYDFGRIRYSLFERLLSRFVYGAQPALEKRLEKIGLLDRDAFSCACYLPEIGNVPKRGELLAWSESSAVVFVNSMLGARTNRNSVGMEILMNIVGKAPSFGLLTDEGRAASWLVEVKTSALPNPQVLGSAVGMRVVEAVPFVTGLGGLLGKLDGAGIRDYVKDMGAAAASNGAVGLFHVEGVTPEAKDQGRHLLAEGHRTYVVDDAELGRVRASYPVLWKDGDAQPRRCLIGCPHLSSEQVAWWIEKTEAALHRKGRERLAIPTVLNAPPAVVKRIEGDKEALGRLKKRGIALASICPVAFMNNPLSAKKPTITNSNKLRTYSTARFYDDREVLDLITG